jgi:hypothetical protein
VFLRRRRAVNTDVLELRPDKWRFNCLLSSAAAEPFKPFENWMASLCPAEEKPKWTLAFPIPD